jgi:hypothetical protein
MFQMRCFSIRRYVVVDEAHAYGGVFGCHTALILRRLRRICSQVYGSHPTFVVCSATVANPKEHAQASGRPDCRCRNVQCMRLSNKLTGSSDPFQVSLKEHRQASGRPKSLLWLKEERGVG